MLYIAGEDALDRLATALDGRIFIPLLLDKVNNDGFWRNEDFVYRHCVIMCISECSENFWDENLILELVDRIVPYMKDASHRIKYASLNAIGQISSDHTTLLPHYKSQLILPYICELLNSNQHPKFNTHIFFF